MATRGRPKKDPDDLLAERLELRLTTAERESYQRAADRAGVSISKWMRDVLLRAAKRRTK